MSAQPAVASNGSGTASSGDLELTRVLETYLADLEAGRPVDADRLMTEHPAIADRLRACLASLHLVEQGAWIFRPEPHSPGEEAPALGRLGDFRIVREIGRGGMGVVYEAEQLSLGRRVALKVLPFAAALDSKQLQRFKNEAHAAAHLHHTNIVPVISVGCERGVHYYAMQHIEGQPLSQVIHELRGLAGRGACGCVSPPEKTSESQQAAAGAPASPLAKAATTPHLASTTFPSTNGPAFFRTAAQLGVQAAEALEHAHDEGVIHRDIKPANLLVDAKGKLWITDFGLARCRDNASLTMSGDMVGTLRYMSPEQALARRVLIDHRTDIYSLAVTFYELLTLEPALDGSDRQELLRQIAFEEPRPPRRLNKAIPAELETIVLKGMEKSPAERYTTAQELADDLRRFLEDKPIKAKRPSLTQQVVKWARRHKAVVRAASVFLVLAMIALMASSALIWQANKDLRLERQRAEEKTRLAEEETKKARRLRYSSDLSAAHEAWRDGHLARARELLDSQRPREGEEDLRGFEWRYLWRLCRDGSLHTFTGHTGTQFHAVSFTPDGTMLASTAEDGTVRLWDVARRRPILSLEGLELPVTSLAFTPDGAILAIASNRIRLWDVASRRQVASWQVAGGDTFIAFTPDGKLLASSSGSGPIKLWDIPTGRERASLPGSGSWFHVAFSPDGRTLAAAKDDTTVRLWDMATRQETAVLRGHKAFVLGLAFSPNGKMLASCGHDATIRLWDLATKQELKTIQGQSSYWSVAFTPDGKSFISGGMDSVIRLWDTATWQPVRTLRGHTLATKMVAVSPNGRTVASGSDDNTVKLWDLVAKPDPEVLPGHEAWTFSVAFSPDGRILASGGAFDHLVKLWDLATGRQLATLPGHQDFVRSLQFTADGKTLVSGGRDKTVRLWDVASGRQVEQFQHTDPVWCTALSPDERILAAGSLEGTVYLWEIATRRKKGPLKGKVPAFDPEGKTLAFGLPDGNAGLYDVRTEQVTATPAGRWPASTWETFRRYGGNVTAVAYSPDGRCLAISADRTINIWDIATRRWLPCLNGHISTIASVAFSPDSKTLASGSGDGTVKLWNLHVLQEAVTLGGHQGQVATVAFAPDGNLLATAGSDGKIRLWRSSSWEDTDRIVEHRTAEAEPERLFVTQEKAGAGALTDWLILAPIPLGEGKSGISGVDEHQIPGERNLQPKVGGSFRVAGKELVWREHHASILDFNAFLGNVTEDSVAYAVCYIESDQERRNLRLWQRRSIEDLSERRRGVQVRQNARLGG